jgi:hypothetical protein
MRPPQTPLKEGLKKTPIYKNVYPMLIGKKELFEVYL